MSDSDESKRALKSFVKMRQPAQPNKFDTFKKPDESVMDCASVTATSLLNPKAYI